MKEKVFVVVLLVCVVTITHAEPTVWYVHPDSVQNCIQDCLDACADNDIVLVGPGTYYENIIWPNTQGIHLISEYGPDTTIIDGNGDITQKRVITISTGVDATTMIYGFLIQNGKAEAIYGLSLGGGIYCSSSSPTIIGNNISNNTAVLAFAASDFTGGGGIACMNSSSVICNRVITDN